MRYSRYGNPLNPLLAKSQNTFISDAKQKNSEQPCTASMSTLPSHTTAIASPPDNTLSQAQNRAENKTHVQTTHDIYDDFKKYALQGVSSGAAIGLLYSATHHFPIAAVVGNAVGSALTHWVTPPHETVPDTPQPATTQARPWAVEGVGTSLAVGIGAVTHTLTYCALQHIRRSTQP